MTGWYNNFSSFFWVKSKCSITLRILTFRRVLMNIVRLLASWRVNVSVVSTALRSVSRRVEFISVEGHTSCITWQQKHEKVHWWSITILQVQRSCYSEMFNHRHPLSTPALPLYTTSQGRLQTESNSRHKYCLYLFVVRILISVYDNTFC